MQCSWCYIELRFYFKMFSPKIPSNDASNSRYVVLGLMLALLLSLSGFFFCSVAVYLELGNSKFVYELVNLSVVHCCCSRRKKKRTFDCILKWRLMLHWTLKLSFVMWMFRADFFHIFVADANGRIAPEIVTRSQSYSFAPYNVWL